MGVGVRLLAGIPNPPPHRQPWLWLVAEWHAHSSSRQQSFWTNHQNGLGQHRSPAKIPHHLCQVLEQPWTIWWATLPPAFLLSELHPSRASQAPPPSRELPQTPGAILPPSYFSPGPFSTTEHWCYRDLSAESTNAPDRTPHGGGTGGQPRTSTVDPEPPLDFRLWEALESFDLWKGPFHHTISPFTMRKHHCTIGSSSKMNMNTYRRQRGSSASMGQIILSTVAFLFRKPAHPMSCTGYSQL